LVFYSSLFRRKVCSILEGPLLCYHLSSPILLLSFSTLMFVCWYMVDLRCISSIAFKNIIKSFIYIYKIGLHVPLHFCSSVSRNVLCDLTVYTHTVHHLKQNCVFWSCCYFMNESVVLEGRIWDLAMTCSATKKKYFYDSIMADSLTFMNLIGWSFLCWQKQKLSYFV